MGPERIRRYVHRDAEHAYGGAGGVSLDMRVRLHVVNRSVEPDRSVAAHVDGAARDRSIDVLQVGVAVVRVHVVQKEGACVVGCRLREPRAPALQKYRA